VKLVHLVGFIVKKGLKIIQWRNVDRKWPLARSNFTSEPHIEMCVWVGPNKVLVVSGSELY
jgi:hypothetical protein